jgi:hypothetical protein
MALDSADFISELSITDPTGTDPINQGDDHIRTVKRATQQSFPNVDAAVPQTAAQMAQMAIKNEANTFTQINTFNQNTIFNDVVRSAFGTALTPSYSFTDNTNLGMYRAGSNVLAWSTVGVERLRLFATGLRPAVVIEGLAGSAATPGYAFAASLNMGMYRIASGILGFAPSGTEQFRLTSVFAQFAGVLHAPDGTEAAPGYAFTSDLGTGIFASATSLNITANGETIASFTSSSDIFAAEGRSWAGNSLRDEARPAFNFNSDSDTGFYNNAANSIGWATGGVSRGTLDGNAIWTADGISVHGDGASSKTNPAFAFTNDTDTGLYRISANLGGLSAGGTRSFFWSNSAIAVDSGIRCFFSLPTSAGTSGSLWADNSYVRVA